MHSSCSLKPGSHQDFRIHVSEIQMLRAVPTGCRVCNSSGLLNSQSHISQFPGISCRSLKCIPSCYMKQCITSCWDTEHLKFLDINWVVKSQNSLPVWCAFFITSLCLSCSGMQIKAKPHFYSLTITRSSKMGDRLQQCTAAVGDSLVRGLVRMGRIYLSVFQKWWDLTYQLLQSLT